MCAVALALAGAAACGRGHPARPAAVTATCGPAAPAVRAGGEAPVQTIQRRHARAAFQLVYSPDGSRIASIGSDATLRIWDASSRALMRTLSPGEAGVDGFSFVAWDDDTRVLTGSDLAAIAGGDAPVALEPDVRTAARFPGEGQRRWVIARCGQLSATVVADRDGKTLATLAPPGDTSCATALEVSPDGQRVYGEYRSTFAIWDLSKPPGPEGIPARSMPFGPIPTDQFDVTPDESHAFAAVLTGDPAEFVIGGLSLDGREEGDILLDLPAELRGSNAESDPPMPKTWVNNVRVSPDGKTVVAATSHELIAWDLATRAIRWRDRAGARMGQTELGGSHDGFFTNYWRCHGYYCDVAFAPDGRTLVAGTLSGRMISYDVGSGSQHGAFGAAPVIADELLWLDARHLAMRGSGRVTVWSLGDGAPAVLGETARWVQHLERTEDGKLVLYGAAADPRCGAGVGAIRSEVLETLAPLAAASSEDDPHRRIRSDCVLEGSAAGADRLDDVSVELGRAVVTRLDAATRGMVTRVIDLAGGTSVTLEALPDEKIDDLSLAAGRRRLSHDGRWVIDAATVTHVWPMAVVWDAHTGRKIAELAVADDGSGSAMTIATGVGISDDGSRLAVTSAHAVDLYALADLASAPPKPISRIDDGEAALAAAGFGARAVWTTRERTQALRRALGPEGRVAEMRPDAAIAIRDAKRELATLVEFDDREWVIATPRGAYTGTPEVGQRIGWLFGAPAELFGFAQLASSFERRDLVVRRLSGEEVDIEAPITRPPRVTLGGGPVLAAGGASARVSVDVASGRRVDVVRAWVEGRLVATRPVCAARGKVSFDLPLQGGLNRVSVQAFDDRGFASGVLAVDLRRPSGRRPDLFVRAIGVSAYPQLPSSDQLAYADDDAVALAQAFAAQAGPGADRPFAHADVEVLTDAQADVRAVTAALGDLARMKPDDVAVVLLAGHGLKLTDGGQMIFLTSRSGLDRRSLEANGVGWDAISAALARARGRVVLLLDACHSGHVSKELVIQNDALADSLVSEGRAGVVVFAASKGQQLSYEPHGARSLRHVADDALRRVTPAAPSAASDRGPGHGFFTGAILASMTSPETDADHDGVIQLSELIDEVSTRVEEATSGNQTPWVARREIFGDFAVAAAPAAAISPR